MKIRTGRHNRNTLYLQTGPVADNADPPLGFCVTHAAAHELARVANAGIQALALAASGDESRLHDFGLPAEPA